MIRGLFRLLGNLALIAAMGAFLTSVSLLLLGSFLLTWPVLRKSPRDQKLQAATQLAAAGLAMVQAFGNRDSNPVS